ncbi:hypothetical protein CLOSTMETH_01532 [[Clostridium] methylpentosum DSM 5476]|uniref:Uncharacterized protein n=1 Tax=[Clostridium] methylpentosum DSM 5476 TaxID=537013 RepID=C0ECG2_9FIRM|nr:hypothetical protein CLOSTMETH_01532 [[Clostridium] methylpentosum DSM 5476]
MYEIQNTLNLINYSKLLLKSPVNSSQNQIRAVFVRRIVQKLIK